MPERGMPHLGEPICLDHVRRALGLPTGALRVGNNGRNVMDKFFEILEGPFGRALRIALGIVLVYLGVARMSGTGGRVLAIAGLLPIAMGLWGPCLLKLAIRRLRRA